MDYENVTKNVLLHIESVLQRAKEFQHARSVLWLGDCKCPLRGSSEDISERPHRQRFVVCFACNFVFLYLLQPFL
jgi:hypothetical protein